MAPFKYHLSNNFRCTYPWNTSGEIRLFSVATRVTEAERKIHFEIKFNYPKAVHWGHSRHLHLLHHQQGVRHLMQWIILCCEMWHPQPLQRCLSLPIEYRELGTVALTVWLSFHRTKISWENSHLAVFPKVTQEKVDSRTNFVSPSLGTCWAGDHLSIWGPVSAVRGQNIKSMHPSSWWMQSTSTKAICTSEYSTTKHLGGAWSWQAATISLRQSFEKYRERSLQFMMHI